jgi:Fe-S-cluster-containing dehydrogenase component
MNPTRRGFFKTMGLAGAGFLTTAPAGASEAPRANDDEAGMLYDATLCVGCKACMAVCKRVNGGSGDLAPERASFDEDGLWDAPEDLSGSTRTLIKLFKEQGKWSYIKYSCMQCQTPSCVSVCPVSAMTKDETTGIVSYNKDVCIGCRYCQVACAFNIPKFQWGRAMPQIVKCDLCRSTYLKQKGLPACADVCPAGALRFGKRGELLAAAHARLKEHPRKYVPRVYGEREVGGTNVLILAGVAFEKLGLPTLPTEPPATFAEKIQHTIYKDFVAPIGLYGALCLVALKNMKKNHGKPHPPSTKGET